MIEPLIPLRYQAVKAERIALALLDGVFRGQSGECIIRAYPVVTHTKLKTPLSFQFAAKPAQHRSADAENRAGAPFSA